MAANLPGIAEIRRIQLRPGDRLVVQLDHQVDDEEFDRLLGDLRKAFSPDVPILLIEPGIDITVIGPADSKVDVDVAVSGPESGPLLKAIQAEVRKAGGDPLMVGR